MLSDRSYMRDANSRTSPSVLAWFLGLLVGGFVLQQIFGVWIGSTAPLDHGALSSANIRAGKIWTLFSYALLHGGLGHLLLNGLGIFFIGRELQNRLGPDRFLKLILVGALGAGLVWLGVHLNNRGRVIGASGVLMAFLAVFAAQDPRRPIQLLVFFVLPVTVQPIWLVGVLGSIDLLGFLFYELPKNQTLYGVAHSAHLGGLAAGWLFYRLVLVRPASNGTLIEPPAWFRRKTSRPVVVSRVNVEPRNGDAAIPPPTPARRDALRAEVDRILDKINLHGFGSLSAEEKRILDEARNHLNPR